MPRNDHTLSTKMTIEYTSGTIAGGTLALVTCPLENAKICQQTSSEKRNVRDWMRTIAARNGLAGLYRGGVAHIIQAGFGRGFYIGAYFMVKEIEDGRVVYRDRLSRPHALSSSTLLGKIFAGAGAGIAGWMFTYPFDVVRSNMMRDWRVERYTSTSGCFASLWKTGGLRQLYSGLGFTLMRAIPAACVALPTYEYTKNMLTQRLLA